MDNTDIDTFFEDTSVASTSEVAELFGISDVEARALADEVGVRMIGTSYAWTRDDVEDAAEVIDELDEDDDDDDDDDDDEEDEEDDEEEGE